jgi:hypothetical protein
MAVCKPNPHIAGNRKAALVGSVRRNSGPMINSNMFHAVETLRLGYDRDWRMAFSKRCEATGNE